ncbi:MAG: C-methyltransferase [Gammaproteobacteria bacterium]|nr:MAG: C-methyltransferase [Gammaproteobacteria bacterium]TND05341.1 MAG: C-methyltransferase [Gammaproteobacteria bacterium]
MTQNKSACRFCDSSLEHSFADLGMSPLSNSYLKTEQINMMEPFFPLHAYVCKSCFLVQLEEYQSPDEIFSDYAYFSSYSESWLRHAKSYVEKMVLRFKLGVNSQVVEIASNDGYLLQYFVERDVPVLGVEPAANVAEVARDKGVETIVKFFGVQTARELAQDNRKADLIAGNNVLAHVPDINDFVKGLSILLKDNGVITMEFPHLARLMAETQFDTIYHEHFSYLSLIAVEKIFAAHGLVIFDVEELPTHGGSLRIYACHSGSRLDEVGSTVVDLRNYEFEQGLAVIETYDKFAEQVKEAKRKLLEFLIREKRSGKSIVAYGAAAKGNTLLNYCGVRTDFIEYAVDRSRYKQGMYLPGTHIPIYSPDKIKETRPDYILILPWNLKNEIMEQMAYVREWGGKFVTPIPEVTVYQ